MSLPPDVDVKMSTMIKGEDDKDLLRSNEANNMEIMTDQRKMLSIGTLPYMKYVATSIWNNLGPFRIPTQEKFIYLPTKLVQKWQEDCQKEVDQNTEDGNKSIRLTKNDVITAWFFIVSSWTSKNLLLHQQFPCPLSTRIINFYRKKTCNKIDNSCTPHRKVSKHAPNRPLPSI